MTTQSNTADTQQHHVHLLYTGKTLAFGSNPDTAENNEAGIYVQGALNRILELNATTEKVKTNALLTGLGQADKLRPEREKAIMGITDMYAKLQGYSDSVKRQEEALYAWPKIDPANSAVAIEDREIRDWVRSQTGTERTNTLKQIQGGDYPRITLALVRSPIPLGVPEQLALDAWNNAIRKEKPYVAEAVDLRKESVAWAEKVLQQIAQQAVLLAEFDLKATVDFAQARIDVAKSTTPNTTVEGWRLFGVTEAQWKQTVKALESERARPMMAS